MHRMTDRTQCLSRLHESNLKNRGGKEKLKYAEKKIVSPRVFQKESETGGDFSKIPTQIRQRLGLGNVNEPETVRNCRIVSDEYVREMMKKYGKEIRRV